MLHRSRIFQVVKETHDTYSLKFERPSGFDYTPGQYCLFQHDIDGQQVKRAYSLSSSPTEDFLQITVKHMEHGKMSSYLTALHPKDELEFLGPLGKFVLTDDLKSVVFIAGGSGISPFRAMVRSVIDRKRKTDMALVYGCRSQRDIIMDREFQQCLKSKRFHLFVTVDNPEGGWPFHCGFIDAPFIREATAGKPLGRTYFVCGPPLMVENVKKALHTLGVKDEDIRLDVWG